MPHSFHSLFLVFHLCLLNTIHTTATTASCSITTFTNTTTTSSTTINTSSCTFQSIAACPVSYDPCCAYICAEAQVPFLVCAPENRTVLAQCTQCHFPTTTPITTTTTTANAPYSIITTNDPSSSATGQPSAPTTAAGCPSSGGTGTLQVSTCTPRLLTAGPACPTPYDPCCAWKCAEAQVPYEVCQPTDGSGEFAVCERCPTA